MWTVRDGTNGMCGQSVGVRRRRRRAWQFRPIAAPRQLDDRLADGLDRQASCRQHFGRDAALLAQQSEQQVFGAYVAVRQPIGFFGRVLQCTLAGRAEGNVDRLRDVLAASEATATGDVAAKLVEGVTGSRKDPGAKPVAFVQHPKEDVLGLDGARSEPADLGASEEEDLDRWLRESIEHTWLS